MEGGRDSDSGAGSEDKAACDRARPSALALCAPQRRCAGRGAKAPPPPPPRRPKDIVMGWVEKWATSGGSTGPSNRITLLRDSKGDSTPELRSVFLDHLNSPFGVALVGN